MAAFDSPDIDREPTTNTLSAPDWWVFRGTGRPRPGFDLDSVLPPPPQWRTYRGGPPLPPPPTAPDEETRRVLGPVAGVSGNDLQHLDEARHQRLGKINAAILLRRPLLVSGPPGVGKSALADQIARELDLGPVLRWTVGSRTTVRSGLYDYDPIAQIHDLNLENSGWVAPEPDRTDPADRRYADAPDEVTAQLRSSARRIGRYLRIGPLGTAFLPYRLPRVLLIDEFDKGDFDLAGDLLELFETGRYRIPELARLRSVAPEVDVPVEDLDPVEGVERTATVTGGQVECAAFPVVVITCNSDRVFAPAFLRRCIPLHLPLPSQAELETMIAGHFSGGLPAHAHSVLTGFSRECAQGSGLSIDQLLNAVYLTTEIAPASAGPVNDEMLHQLGELAWHRLTDGTA